MPVTIPRIIIAGTHSGCGKTTVASGLMAALTERGLKVQPFKTGPDFIDPSHHSATCGRVSRNLDPFMMGEAGVLRTFFSASGDADIAVIEGAMGLFDGIDGTDFASTAHVARILHAPVILVVDAYAASRSVHAMVHGFRTFDPRIRIAGVIFNRIATGKHRDMIAVEEIVPALGWIPHQRGSEVGSRHLGLVMAHESDGMNRYGRIVRESCDLDRILDMARDAPLLADPPAIPTPAADNRRSLALPAMMRSAFTTRTISTVSPGPDRRSGSSRRCRMPCRMWTLFTLAGDTRSCMPKNSKTRHAGRPSGTWPTRACRYMASVAGSCTCAGRLLPIASTLWRASCPPAWR